MTWKHLLIYGLSIRAEFGDWKGEGNGGLDCVPGIGRRFRSVSLLSQVGAGAARESARNTRVAPLAQGLAG